MTLSRNVKIGIGIAASVLLAVGLYFALRKKTAVATAGAALGTVIPPSGGVTPDAGAGQAQVYKTPEEARAGAIKATAGRG